MTRHHTVAKASSGGRTQVSRGRQKVEFCYMEDKVRRGVTFCKRKQGLLKKAIF